ncbi:hypothetical protein [Pontibacter arcticus]|uniref:Outer membrane protein beta-barrel domain-containing protein n=1 Tax=Pontibacter arcticus TaxID=2080288 RepID=A0A364RI19_9BACT|nr:hypothetical protein [Pontibacter arcticus]RAU83942.1 hypothetical protein DP923_02440 [Pontibacter arcticus]
MKTSLLIFLACLCTAYTSDAQMLPSDSTAVTALKAQAKHVATELNVNPFNGTLSLNNSINQLKFRYFTTPNLAIRLGFNGNRVNDFSENSTPYGTNPSIYKNERSSTTLGVNLGIEKHFAGTRRLSPYVGADLIIENKTSENEITNGQTVRTITGGWQTSTFYPANTSYPYNNPSYTVYSYDERGFFRYGINLVSGFDFYMAKNFFFGYEVNFGFSQKTLQDLEIKTSNSDNSPIENREVKDTSFSFGPSLMNGVRVGYVF